MTDMHTQGRATVRVLNDKLRRHHVGGTIVVTPGIRALGSKMLSDLVTAVSEFDAFTIENDPYEDHDFGSVSVNGHVVFFKIDSYDRDLRYHSPDPADPAVTCRVMTLMLAEEY